MSNRVEFSNDNPDFEYLFGINPVRVLLEVNAGGRQVYDILMDGGRRIDKRLNVILNLANKKGIKVRKLSSGDFNKLARRESHTQGVCARVSPYNCPDLGDYLYHDIRKNSRLLVLDGVTDAGNFGAIIRSCLAFDFDGILVPRKRNVQLNRSISRISSGALEGIRIFSIGNVTRTIGYLKESGFWIYGTTLDKSDKVQTLDMVRFNLPLALILGSEDRGMSRLVGKNCDVLVTIRLRGRIQSLNVSMASAIFMHEIQKQADKQL